jgi:hypothetical protein
LHQFGGIACLSQCFGKDDSYRLADMAHPVARQGPARRFRHRRAVGRGDGPQRRHWSDIVGRHVRASEYGGDARLPSGGANINSANLGMRVRRAHQYTMQLTR